MPHYNSDEPMRVCGVPDATCHHDGFCYVPCESSADYPSGLTDTCVEDQTCRCVDDEFCENDDFQEGDICGILLRMFRR